MYDTCPLSAAGLSRVRPVIGNASLVDLEEILAIYNEVIRNSTAVYTEQEYDAARGRLWFDGRTAQGFPFIVARVGGEVAAFAGFGEFRAWPCYRHTVEHSVHVRADFRGRGIGRLLITDLKARAAGMGKHSMIAGIDAQNQGSIRLHESLGFVRAGHLHEVGFKFGRWLDLVFLECIFPATSRPAS